MDVVAAILGLVAVILLILLITTRRNARIAASLAGSSRSALQSDLTTAQREKTRAVEELEAAGKKSVAAVDQARSDLAVSLAGQTHATERAVAAEATQAEQLETIGSLERYSVELKTEIAKASEEAQAAKATAADAAASLRTVQAEADELRRASTGRTGSSVGNREGIDPELLWALEMTRSERTWRHSVAVDPDGPSPFADAFDPLRLAVEVEAAAMREEVGAFIHLRWEAEAVADPIRRLLVLRIANELLAAAAREPQPFEMIATGSDEILLRVHSTEEDDRQIELEPPRFGTDVITYRADDDGISVTIR